MRVDLDVKIAEFVRVMMGDRCWYKSYIMQRVKYSLKERGHKKLRKHTGSSSGGLGS